MSEDEMDEKIGGKWGATGALALFGLFGCGSDENSVAPMNAAACTADADCRDAGADLRCVSGKCVARAPTEAGTPPSETSTPLPEAGTVPPCVTGPGVKTLYQGTVTALAVARDKVVIVGDGSIILSVPLAGGTPTVLAKPHYTDGLFVIGTTAYYEEHDPDGGIVPGSGGYPLFAVPTTGGAPHRFLSAFPTSPGAGATDATSYFFTAIRAVGDAGGISMLTPPSTSIVTLTAEKFLAGSIAPYGNEVYFIGFDQSDLSFNGFMGRVSKHGGTAQHLLPGLGLARDLVADESGLYWIQSLYRLSNGIRQGRPYGISHAPFDGTSVVESLAVAYDGSPASVSIADEATSLAALRGRVYFTTANAVKSVGATGGAVTTVAANQDNPAMLTISGSNLVWMTGIENNSRDGSVVLPPDAGDGSAPRDAGDGSVQSEASGRVGGEGGPGLSSVRTACIPE